MNYLNCKKIGTAISRAMIILMERANQGGVYENFGQKEVREIKEKFINISDYSENMKNIRLKLDGFNEWCIRYR